MTSEEFKRWNPEFQHRLLVRKTWDLYKPIAAEVSIWLKETFGQKGDRWHYQPMASPDYFIYWFKDERDLAWAQLRWA